MAIVRVTETDEPQTLSLPEEIPTGGAHQKDRHREGTSSKRFMADFRTGMAATDSDKMLKPLVSPTEPSREQGDLSAAPKQLIGRIRRSDSAALAELYDATSGQVFGVILRIVGDRAAAEEITSDVFNQVWTQAGKFDDARGSLWSWLLLMARSRAIDFLRSKLRRSRERERGLDPAVHDVSDRMPNPEEQLLISGRRQVVLAALEDLGPEKRKVLEMAFFGGLTHSEIAGQLGAPLGTVKTRIRSALTQLRKTLESQGGGDMSKDGRIPEEFIEMAPLYVLDALLPEEKKAFEERLAKDTALRGQVEELRKIAGLIGFSAEPTAPPPELRDRVLQAIEPKMPGFLHAAPDLVIFRSDDIDWQPHPTAAGLLVKPLYVDRQRGYLTTLLKMEAGAIYPAHVHEDVEEIFIINGEVELQGIAMGPGDYCRAEPGSHHEIGYSKTEALLLVLSSAKDQLEG